MKRLTIASLTLGLWLAGAPAADKAPGQATSTPAAWAGKVTDAAQLPIEQSAWGTLQWVCNEKLMPGSAQTVGLATILPGRQNPVHYHPNCEEVLYVISGQGLHSYDARPRRHKVTANEPDATAIRPELCGALKTIFYQS